MPRENKNKENEENIENRQEESGLLNQKGPFYIWNMPIKAEDLEK